MIITRVKNWDSGAFSPATQGHEPLLFLSGTFKEAQLNWTVGEKEAYPIVAALDKADFLLVRRKPFRLFCDHRNLVAVFAPDASVKNM